MGDDRNNLVLALETSGRRGSVAVLREAAVLASGSIAPDERTAAALTPLIQRTLKDAGVDLADVKLVAVIDGPGSFTGLRVGVTTAKTLAYALGCEVIGLNSLDVIARQAVEQRGCAADATLWAVIDAQRQQLFAAAYQCDADGRLTQQHATAIVDNDKWLAGLSAGEYVTGPGLSRLQDDLPAGVQVVERELWEPTAEVVGKLAVEHFASGRRDDFWKLTPQYFRQSAAEEKAAKETPTT